jgi:hypothetical protein
MNNNMNEGTSIDELPQAPSIQQQMPVQQIPQSQSMETHGQGGIALDQTTISQIVSGIQQASVAGATLLPSRDIPMNASGITHDAAGNQPNYIPPPTSVNYIPSPSQTNQEIIDEYQKREKSANTVDNIYNEIQIPILLALLYFIFQLPIVRKYLLQYLPFLFSTDGNINFNGYVFTSALFGATYYFLNKLMFHFNTF